MPPTPLAITGRAFHEASATVSRTLHVRTSATPQRTPVVARSPLFGRLDLVPRHEYPDTSELKAALASVEWHEINEIKSSCARKEHDANNRRTNPCHLHDRRMTRRVTDSV